MGCFFVQVLKSNGNVVFAKRNPLNILLESEFFHVDTISLYNNGPQLKLLSLGGEGHANETCLECVVEHLHSVKENNNG